MSNPESDILKWATEGSLEVEHLLNLALVGDAATADFLRDLRSLGDWKQFEKLPVITVPYQAWALVVEEYLRNGFSGLESLATDEHARFVIALLEHIHTADSLNAMLDIFSYVICNPEKYEDLSDRLISSLNVVLSFPPAVRVDNDVETNLREFIHRYIDHADGEQRYGTAICALRSVGNSSSVKLIKSKKALSGKWLGTEKIVIAKINARLKRAV